jgi:maltose alpha-D-glucosyltransferase/alpha-amylase
MDPVYGYQAVNVEAEIRDSSSLLHWMKRMLEVRKQHPVFGVGSFEVLGTENPSALAYVRTEGDDLVMCVNNLSRFAQPVELSLQRFAGKVPIEMLGRIPFPPIGELPYFITLGAYQFFWFQLVDPTP